MSSRPALLLLFALRLREKKRFALYFVLPLFVLLSLADSLGDIAWIGSLFRPKSAEGKRAGAALETASVSVNAILWELVRCGPLDLVAVDVRKQEQSVLVKLLTR